MRVIFLSLIVFFITSASSSKEVMFKKNVKQQKTEIFSSKSTKGIESKWQFISTPMRNFVGFEYIAKKRKATASFVAFGLRGLGTIRKPSSTNCETEMSQHKKDKSIKSVKRISNVGLWACLFQSTSISGQTSYYGFREVKRGQKTPIRLQLYFAAVGQLSLAELREVLADTAVKERASGT